MNRFGLRHVWMAAHDVPQYVSSERRLRLHPNRCAYSFLEPEERHGDLPTRPRPDGADGQADGTKPHVPRQRDRRSSSDWAAGSSGNLRRKSSQLLLA